MNILEGLNDSQKEAVKHVNGPLLVHAGAGSGKTRVLTCRIAYLIENIGVSPANILAITFTNKAAAEMKQRIGNMIPEETKELWVSTFHAACLRILRSQARFMNYNNNFVIYDESDKQSVIKECLKELDIDEKKFTPRSVASAISTAKNSLKTAREYKLDADDFFKEKVADVYELYENKLLRNNAMDFDDLLMVTVRLFQSNPSVLQYYQDKFKYILVDEYQDTNHVQYFLVNMLAQTHRNICVVGDPDQSIYRFRGADMQNILDFEKDYSDAHTVLLEQNYRSTQTILNSANNIISNNVERKDKKLWTAGPEGDLVILFTGYNEHAEASFLADRVLRLKEKGYNYNDMAVLYRTHAQSRVLEEKFLYNNIPYTMVGGLRFYERKEIKDLIAYLRLLVNPYDRVSLRRIINVPKRGIGNVSVEKILEQTDSGNVNFIEILNNAEKINKLAAKTRSAAKEFGESLALLMEKKENISVTELTEETLFRTGYWHFLQKENSKESQTRQENLQEFLTVTQEFDREQPEGSLEDFLSGLALVTDMDNYDEDSDQITMMTLHGAKGLEFPVVFLAGMEEGIFPHARSLNEPAEMEEERRICYVGITRARERLYITHCYQRTLYGYTRANKSSRFLKEIPEECITTRDPLDAENPTFENEYAKTREEYGSSSSFVPGDHVYHRKWGNGIVTDIRGHGDKQEIKVNFTGLGIKTLMACYAPLERQN
ncbi:MAG: DNA helicase PcrA [Clostridiales bacterium]|nr:DNA helicase PcrA [Clostridiales bacterium]MCF8021672.1 DNA helicase PcrA [Clostridiales bacterium]